MHLFLERRHAETVNITCLNNQAKEFLNLGIPFPLLFKIPCPYNCMIFISSTVRVYSFFGGEQENEMCPLLSIPSGSYRLVLSCCHFKLGAKNFLTKWRLSIGLISIKIFMTKRYLVRHLFVTKSKSIFEVPFKYVSKQIIIFF